MIKHIVEAYALLLVVDVLLRIKPINNFFELEDSYPYDRNSIIVISFLTAILICVIDAYSSAHFFCSHESTFFR